jgi:hypothetical protein
MFMPLLFVGESSLDLQFNLCTRKTERIIVFWVFPFSLHRLASTKCVIILSISKVEVSNICCMMRGSKDK